LYSIYDKPRIWFLGTFILAAREDIPHGAEWARKVMGCGDPPKGFVDLTTMAKIYRRPLYHLIWQEKVRVHPDPNINRIVTGAKLLVNPVATRLMQSELYCIQNTVDFILPTIVQAPQEGREAVEALIKGITKQKDFSIAA
jgi:hypothetical protein